MLALDCSGGFIADQKATCANGKLDDKGEAPETDIDCGGTGCIPCEREKKCALNSDCGAGLSCLTDPTNSIGILRCQWTHCADNKRNQDETDNDCGGSCWPCTSGQKCKSTADCDSQVCSDGLCSQASCIDGVRNQDETDTDCGSLLTECPGCAAGKTCTRDENCDSGVCESGKCALANCNDSRKNGDEGGVDCGGSCPLTCGQSSSCNKDADCTSKVCRSNQCLSAACSDGVQNGNESDVDCGGTCGSTCVTSAGCNVDMDCVYSFCNAHICQMPTCTDQIKNEGETDIDCGDPYGLCPRCTTGNTCLFADNCDSRNCSITDKRCIAPTCSDLIINQHEGDIDCGGECVAQKCQTGATCRLPSDCASGVCTEGRCAAAVCPDGVMNGQETDKDCGGPESSCAIRCGIGLNCGANSDCNNNSCFAGKCQIPSCGNLIKDGNETDADCGGADCAKCIANKKCAKDEDCLSLNCDDKATLTCIADSCFDLIKNGNETFADCGGSCEKNCATGQTCLAGADCADGVCNATTKLCMAAVCPDGAKNGLETDVDCGGAACLALATPALCQLGQGCLTDADCDAPKHNLICDAATGKCAKMSCNDGRKNLAETDVDCGGNACAPCGSGKACVANADCKDLICTLTAGKCAAPTCTDAVRNGDEGDKDCGGSICPTRCADTKFCNVGKDCQSGVCSLTSPQVCLAPTCTDNTWNGGETDVDCGGTCATTKKCADGKMCKAVTDCINPASKCDVSGDFLVCTPPGCSDNVKNGDETGKDCGGSCTPCAVGGGCLKDGDCKLPESGKCITGTCAAAACNDLVKNGKESAADCGSSGTGTYPVCSACVDGKTCSTPADCVSKSCNGACLAPTCNDSILNGSEVDTDCGSACGTSKLCIDGKICNANADCVNGWCNASKICKTPSCTDGILNGSEGDTDCGASCVTKLCTVAAGQGCKKDLDCDSATCSECTGKCIKAATGCYAMGTSCSQCVDGQPCSANFDCKSLTCDTANKLCLAPNNCYGKVIDGTGCSADCMMLVRCLFANGLTLAAATASPDGACGANKFGKGTAMYGEAKTALAAVGGCP